MTALSALAWLALAVPAAAARRAVCALTCHRPGIGVCLRCGHPNPEESP